MFDILFRTRNYLAPQKKNGKNKQNGIKVYARERSRRNKTLAIALTATLPPSATEESRLYGREKEDKEVQTRSTIIEKRLLFVKGFQMI